MHVGIVKPDSRILGGFELVVARLDGELARRGHTVSRVLVDAVKVPRTPFGEHVSDDVWFLDGFFRYAALFAAFRSVDLRGFDLVVSTQPPSFAVDHPRHLSIFYHHERFYYDLAPAVVAAGLAYPDVHAVAREAVRELDAPCLEQVTYFLAGSDEVRARLGEFNGLTANVGLLHAGIGFLPETPPPPPADGHVLTVGRQEFPKRQELFVHALKYLPDRRGILVGSGGRDHWAKAVDARLSRNGVDLDAVTDRELWLNTGSWPTGEPDTAGSNITYAGRVRTTELAELFRGALCVVAPAYREDYGLTAIEAMAFGRPVIVCEDGGGLVELVEHGVTGFVVEPKGAAIAEAVGRLAADPDGARAMGERGREVAATFTWKRATAELLAAIDLVSG